MTHLTGLAEKERCERLLLVLQAWIDESADPSCSVFTMCGFIAPAEQWAEFSNAWRERLGTRKSFHMHKDHKMRPGETAMHRDERLSGWVSIIESHVTLRVEVGYSILAFNELMNGKIASATETDKSVIKDINNIYFWTFHEVIGVACRGLVARGHTEQIDFYFDCNDTFSGRVNKHKWFAMARAMASPEIAALLPPTAHFEDDEFFPPLQAADMLSWVASKSWAHNLGADFAWLDERLQVIAPVQNPSPFFGERELRHKMNTSLNDVELQKLKRWSEEFG